MKKAGVPVGSARPSFMSFFLGFLQPVEALVEHVGLEASSLACALGRRRPSAGCEEACRASPRTPWSAAQECLGRLGRVGVDLQERELRNTTRTLSPLLVLHLLERDSRAAEGHWKSENSTIVTGAVAAP
jgi:hypothetical protein